MTPFRSAFRNSRHQITSSAAFLSRSYSVHGGLVIISRGGKMPHGGGNVTVPPPGR
jgi:hypothetical protein